MKYVFKNPVYRILITVFDIFGSIIFFPLRFLKKPPLNPKRILVVRLDHIGDFICTTPLFSNLKKRFPEAKIALLTNSASKELAYRNPYIYKVITYSPFYLSRGEKSSTVKGLMRVVKDVRNIGFDLGLDPRGDLLSILIMWLGGVKYRAGYGITGGGFLLHKEGKYDKSAHVIDRNLALLKDLNVQVFDRSPSVCFNEKDIEVVEELLRGVRTEKKTIVLHPFAGARSKEWGYVNFLRLIDCLKNDGYDVLLVGSKDDRGIFENTIDMRGRLSLPQLAYLIKSAGAFIGLDSGPANIAAALNVPSVIICSGTNMAQLWVPNNSNVRFVYKAVDCKPCELKICNKAKHRCMELISVDDVVNEIKKALA